MKRVFALALLAVFACKKQEAPTKSVPFTDDFERNELGPDWAMSGGQWNIDKGQVFSTGANNSPLFLKVALPKDVVVEVEVTSETPLVDSKIELMTNGRAHSSGYVFILGGWSNTISCIARLDEHGADRKEKKPTGISGAGTHLWRIEKKGGRLDWYVDGQPYLSFDDPEPLDGPGQDRLAFSNWQNRIRYDNLKIWPLDQAPPIKTSTTGR
ncbi:MAG: hypothetical protein IPG45_03465 [Deltaproteobacteria bacterium]|jgi:hypothetical protein|nr:hypothetical protein [Deltaproteobacteria bacterium]